MYHHEESYIPLPPVAPISAANTVRSPIGADGFSLIPVEPPPLDPEDEAAQRREAEALQQQLFYYIPPTLKLLDSEQETQITSSWQDMIHAFLGDRILRLILLQGDSGGGKSISLLKLKQDCDQLLQRQPAGWQVIYLELKRFNRESAKRCVQTAIQELNQGSLQDWQARPTLLLLDGYDEISGSAPGNLYEENQLKTWDRLKVIIACRAQVLPARGYERDFAPLNEQRQIQRIVFRNYKVAPFDVTQTQAYLKLRVQRQSPESPIKTVEEYQHHFDNIPGLRELIQTPLLLRIAVEALPMLLQEGAPAVVQNPVLEEKENDAPAAAVAPLQITDSLVKLTRARLYEAFMRQWFMRQAHKGLAAHVSLSDLLKSFHGFAKRLALTMANEDLVEIYYESHNPQTQIWAQFLASPEEAQRLAREACPLRALGGGRYSFVHKSFLEYFTAKGIWDALSLSHSEIPQPQEKVQNPGVEHARLIQMLGVKPEFILADPAVIDFLKELSSTQPGSVSHLFGWIERTKKYSAPADGYAAACAATLINALGQAFAQCNGERTYLPGTDFSGALLRDARFKKANVTGSRFRAASMTDADFRGANLLNIQLGQAPMIQLKETIHAIAHHPHKPLLAIALGEGGDARIELWDTQKRILHKTLERWSWFKRYTEYCLAFSPDGKHLASGGKAWDVRLWDIEYEGYQDLTVLGSHQGDVLAVAFSSDGKYLASGGEDNTVRLWDLETKQVRICEGHKRPIKSLVFHPESGFVSGSDDGVLRLWGLGGVCSQVLEEHGVFVECLAFNSKGQLASGNKDGTVRLWDLSGGRSQVLEGHRSAVKCIAFSSENVLASGSSDGAVRLWDLVGGRSQVLAMHGSAVTCLAFNLEGRLASGSGDTVRLWDLSGGRSQVLEGHTSAINCLTFSHNDRLVSSSGLPDSTIRLWNLSEGRSQVLQKNSLLDVPTGYIKYFALSFEGRLAILRSRNNTVQCSDLSGGVTQPLEGHTGPVNCLAFSVAGKLASGSEDKTVRLWKFPEGSSQMLEGHTGSVNCVAFSVAGQLASGSEDKTVRLWKFSEGSSQILEGHTGAVNCLAFSVVGQLVSGSDDETVRLWNLPEGRSKELKGHLGSIKCLAFSSEGRLVSGSSDKTVRLWDLNKRTCLQTLRFEGAISALAFSQQGLLAVAYGKRIDLFFYQAQSESYVLQQSFFPSNILKGRGVQLSDVEGLSAQNALLLQQLGAKGGAEAGTAVPKSLPPRAHQRCPSLERSCAPFDEAIRRMPQYAQAFIERGQLIANHRAPSFPQHPSPNFMAALSDYDQVIQLQPYHPQVYTQRAIALLERNFQGDREAALRDLQESLRIQGLPANQVLHLLLKSSLSVKALACLLSQSPAEERHVWLNAQEARIDEAKEAVGGETVLTLLVSNRLEVQHRSLSEKKEIIICFFEYINPQSEQAKVAFDFVLRARFLPLVKILAERGVSIPARPVSPGSISFGRIERYLEEYQALKAGLEVKHRYRNLVFQGGSVKGIAYPGALRQAVERKLIASKKENDLTFVEIDRVGGASAGAINALLLGLNYSLEEVEHIVGLCDLPHCDLPKARFAEFLDGPFGAKLIEAKNREWKKEFWDQNQVLIEKLKRINGVWSAIGNIPSIYDAYQQGKKLSADILPFLKQFNAEQGLCPGLVLRNLFNDLILRQLRKRMRRLPENPTFAELYQFEDFKEMYFMGVNLETGEQTIFSYEHTPNVVVADAVRISMSIPGVFVPHPKVTKDKQGRLQMSSERYSDGGVLLNYPVTLFDRNYYRLGQYSNNAVTPNEETLGFRLVKPERKAYYEQNIPLRPALPPGEAANAWQNLKNVLMAIKDKQESDHQANLARDHQRTVYISIMDVGMLDFERVEKPEVKDALTARGREAIDDFLRRSQQQVPAGVHVAAAAAVP